MRSAYLAAMAIPMALSFPVLDALDRPIDEREIAVTFTSDDVTLAGTLILPAGKAPHPAIVFLHGSGPGPGSEFRLFAEALRERGIASLSYDKRGSGASTGDWVESSLDDLAADAVAALEFLKARGDIDAERVGFWGFSQAGWVAARAAGLSDDIGFLVIVTGGGARPYDAEMFSYAGAMRHAGLSPEEQSAARSLLDQYFDYLATGDGRAELETAIDAARSEPWLEVTGLDDALVSEAVRPHWQWVATFDPLPYVAQMRFPALVLFGGQDMWTPTELSAARWREGLLMAGNEDFTIEVIPGAGHGLTVGGHSNSMASNTYVDGYPAMVVDWIAERVAR